MRTATARSCMILYVLIIRSSPVDAADFAALLLHYSRPCTVCKSSAATLQKQPLSSAWIASLYLRLVFFRPNVYLVATTFMRSNAADCLMIGREEEI